MTISKTSKDFADLQKAVALLEATTITEQISQIIGTPVELLLKKLPKSAEKNIHKLTIVALQKASEAALWSLDNEPGRDASTKTNKLFAALSGAVGGAFGFAALPVELPISTTIMLRSIADIARSEGFNLEDYSTKQACLEVFYLGGPSKTDDASKTAYYGARGFATEAMYVLSKELAEVAARHAASNSVSQNFSATQSGKWLASLVEKVATRFGIVITEKAAAQIAPILGAISGASLNMMFTDFYQDMARGHFIIKRLEEKYGFLIVKTQYEELASK